MLHSSISMVQVILVALFLFFAMIHVSKGLKESSIHSPLIRRKQDHKHDGNHHKQDKPHDHHGKVHHKDKPKPAQHKDDHHKNDHHKEIGRAHV